MIVRARALAFVLAAATALSGAPAFAQGGATETSESSMAEGFALADVLSLIDVLLTREMLDAVGVDASGQALRDAVTDESLPMYPRIRAVHGLAYYYNPETALFLGALARDGAAAEPLRVAAVVVAASDPRAEAGAAVDALLDELASDGSAEVRAAVERGRARAAAVRAESPTLR